MHGYFGAVPTKGIEYIQRSMQSHAQKASAGQWAKPISPLFTGGSVPDAPSGDDSDGMDMGKVLPIAAGMLAALFLLK